MTCFLCNLVLLLWAFSVDTKQLHMACMLARAAVRSHTATQPCSSAKQGNATQPKLQYSKAAQKAD